jgi:hypothetical protein
VSRFWLTYCKPSGRQLFGVVILDSPDIIQARLHAVVKGINQGADFAEGHDLDEVTAALLPATAIGRMLSQDEAGKLIRRIERSLFKMPPRKRLRDGQHWTPSQLLLLTEIGRGAAGGRRRGAGSVPEQSVVSVRNGRPGD